MVAVKPDNMKLDLLSQLQGLGFSANKSEKIGARFMELLAADVENGSHVATQTLSVDDPPFNFSYEQSGILKSVLNFLKRCEDETLDDVTSNLGLHESGGEKVTNPSLWIEILIKAAKVEPSCRLQIAENIGPLVKCMCNDTTRLFFKNNKHWKEGIYSFVALVSDILSEAMDPDHKGSKKKTVKVVLEYEGLLRSIVQWGFWNNIHRPDIVKELDEYVRQQVIQMGILLVGFVTNYASNEKDAAGILTEDSRSILKSIGSEPIVSKEYDASCTVSFAAALIRQMTRKEEDYYRTLTRMSHDGTKEYLFIIEVLLYFGGCIDKDVISEVIGLGFNLAADFDSVELVLKLSRFILIQETSLENILAGKTHLSDTRAAFAIRAGLIEMCLGVLDCFGMSESISTYIEGIFGSINGVSLHQKTARAIRSKRGSIEDKLISLEQKTERKTPKKKKLLGMLRSILDINGSYCCRCNKSLTRTEVMVCNGCHCMAYCSRACQREDWSNGHSVTCCKSYTYNDRTTGYFQGRILPITAPDDERAATKLTELEININMIQLKLLLDHSETILNQAKDLGIPLCDCVVKFDLRSCPPKVTTKIFTFTPEAIKVFDQSRSKKNITCLYYSYFFNVESEEVPRLAMQRLFPHEWLVSNQSKS